MSGPYHAPPPTDTGNLRAREACHPRGPGLSSRETETPMNARAILERLIAFETVSDRPNVELVHWVRDLLATAGVAATLIPDAAGGKANLYATAGPQDRPGVMLSGHTDVVPVDRPGLDPPALSPDRKRRPALRPRRRRHEGLRRLRARRRARDRAAAACAPRSTSRSATTRRSAASACAR